MDKINYIVFFVCCLVVTSCNFNLDVPLQDEVSLKNPGANKTFSETKKSWNFSNPVDYQCNGGSCLSGDIVVAAGSADLQLLDTSFSGTDFSSGDHYGTQYDSGSNSLTLRTSPELSTTHVNTILPSRNSNLVGYWRFEGDFTDSSGNNNNGTAVGNTVLATNGKVGNGSAEFDGTGDYLNVGAFPAIEGLSNVTVSLWMYSHGNGQQGLFAKYNSNGFTSAFWTDDRIYFDIVNMTSGRISTNPNIYLYNNWNHIVYVNDNTHSRIYINGVEVQSGAVNQVIPTDGTDFYIGMYKDASSEYSFDGLIDEFAVWNESLSPAEVRSLYAGQNANFTELSSNWTPQWNSLVGYWKMDRNWHDSSGNGNHGTAEGGVAFNYNPTIAGNGNGFFDGNNDVVRLGSINSANPLSLNNSNFTISSWVYRENTSDTWPRIVDKSDAGSGANGYALSVGSDNRIDLLVNGQDYLTSPLSDNVSRKKWFHLAVTMTTSRIRFYVDGVLFHEETSGPYALPPATTTNMSIGSWNHSTARELNGRLDELAIFSTELSSAEVNTIYQHQKQKYVGSYESPIIDMGSAQNINSLTPFTELPFQKELGTANDNPLHYPALSSNLSSGLVAYWPLNESILNSISGWDFEDKSSNSNHGYTVGSVVINQAGIADRSVCFGPNAEQHIQIPNNPTLRNMPQLTIQTWVKFRDKADWDTIFLKYRGSTNNDNTYGFMLDNSTDQRLYFNANNTSATPSWIRSDGPIPVNKWTHVVGTYDGINTRLYINGVLQSQIGNLTGNIANYTSNNDLYIGNGPHGGGNNNQSKSCISDAAIWNRAISASEVLQLYRRNANRVKYQIRTCTDSTCSTNPEWIGPGGDGTTAFSEIYNRQNSDISNMFNSCDSSGDNLCSDREFSIMGPSLLNRPQFNLLDYLTGNYASLNARYFQYRVQLEAQENTTCNGAAEACLPSLNQFDIGIDTVYNFNSPHIQSSVPLMVDGEITRFKERVTGSCTVNYQFSRNGLGFFYYNGSNWTPATGAAQSNTATELTPILKRFIVSGPLYFKAYLTSDGSQDCELENIEITVRK